MLSAKQQKVLDFSQAYIQQHSFAPTVREIQKGLGYQSSSTIHGFLGILEEKGYIEKRQSSPRTLKILKSG